MRRRAIQILFILLFILIPLTSCTKGSYFTIHFIDVGQGDSALIECDGHCMLIDGGDKRAGEKVYDELVTKGIQHLDILAISHLHEDHIGGLIKVLSYVSSIDKTITNTGFDTENNELLSELENQLGINGAKISSPSVGEKYELGSATIEVIDVSAEKNNDSLVLLVTYGKTSFLFTGDIEESAQKRIANKYQNDSDTPFKVSLVKMPHHGAYSNTLYTFIRSFMPDYIVISVGANNIYGHPDQRTLDLFTSKTYNPKVYRTDLNGDIIVKSNGKSITVQTDK